MNYYNPFDVPFSLITTESLKTLCDVSEGWYVEYKEKVPNPSSIAKSISAFANTYGGWLFYGIKEKSKDEPVASEFFGFDRSEIDGYLNRIRQSVNSHVIPAPHFDMKVLWGPLDQTSLGLEQAIICIWIPWSPKAPHVHRSGIIYRRVSEASEPFAENDRFILDELFKRSDSIISEYKRWVETDPDFTEEEKKHPYLRLLISADLWNQRDVWLGLSINDVRKIFNPDDVKITMPFDSIHTTSSGFVARQLKNNDPSTFTATWYLNKNLKSEILIPISYYSCDDPLNILDDLKGYAFINEFVDILKKYKFKSINILDINLLLLSILGIIEINKEILKAAKWNLPYYIKIKILNGNRHIPFLDIKQVITFYEKSGIPVLLKTSMSSDYKSHPDSFIELKPDTDTETTYPSNNSLLIFFYIISALGISILEDNIDEQGAIGKLISDTLSAANRAIEAQRLHNLQPLDA